MSHALAERFPIGTRVIESPLMPRAPRRCRDGIYRVGVVVGYSRHAEAVRVRFDGAKSVMAFHQSFLDIYDARQVESGRQWSGQADW